jgi:histidinol dehydrogenase
MRTITYNDPEDFEPIRAMLSGRQDTDAAVESTVREILDRVRESGDLALVEYTRRFDCPDFDPAMLRVPPAAVERAMGEIPRDDLDILEQAAANIRSFHEHQLERSWMITSEDGGVLGQLVRPVDRAGLYVPGGQGGETPLLSSLLMNAIPAQVAGVREIAVVSPPRRDGTLNPSILAAAAILGIDEIYLCGSAWSVAALAFGTRAIPAVDVIAGPGNIYVTTAKRLLMGRVGIDMIAGPSEILVLADHTADPGHIAADLLSQAEHDPQAAALLVTTDESLAERTVAAVREQLARLPRTGIAEQALERFGATIVVPDLATGVEVVNRVAPEHLELLVQDPWALLGSIRHAGAIFMGPHSPEPVGDYFAGPNHVLPTMGTARFSSALTVQTFVKRSSIIATSARFLEANGAKIARMARMEGLEAHARSVEVRLKDKG